ncbi:response regulator transcription factor [Parathalassolituus penaei]|uniref:Response regulator transcription factor n=1 Tax=Parathalassolituus penaei TaxID=2997323 RepID=A0A9X3IVD1_9GAMM|nr:response regulator transcription factor [Parathalassolituus penaei]MCY0967133.1 response regulator transcription factor [Parathalassolituus penaei]
MLNVLLVEDDIDLAVTVVDYLALENIHCDHASNGVAGLSLLEQQRYDVLLLDLNLPRLDGLSVCTRLRQQGNDVPVLMLTARDQLTDKLDGFQAGTDDYLVKPFDLEELVVRVMALSRRRSGQVQKLRCADLEMNLASHETMRNGRVLKLSPTAWKLLECLLRASPRPLSREQLMQAVWGDEQPDSNSLKVHLFNLRKQLDQDGELPLLHTLAGTGFALREQADDGQNS